MRSTLTIARHPFTALMGVACALWLTAGCEIVQSNIPITLEDDSAEDEDAGGEGLLRIRERSAAKPAPCCARSRRPARTRAFATQRPTPTPRIRAWTQSRMPRPPTPPKRGARMLLSTQARQSRRQSMLVLESGAPCVASSAAMISSGSVPGRFAGVGNRPRPVSRRGEP